MKYFYPSAFFILVLLTGLSYSKYSYIAKKYHDTEAISSKFQLMSNNYLNSLTNVSAKEKDTKLLSLDGDSICLVTEKKKCLVYFFSPRDCGTCVRENIFELDKLRKDSRYRTIYIITTIGNRNYLKLVSRAYDGKKMKFGLLNDMLEVTKHHYFTISNKGEMSSTYYPEKGNFESTKRYLYHILELDTTRANL